MSTRCRSVIVAVAIALVPRPATATPARIAALQGNALFEDDTDLFLFPALTAHYGREILLHVPAGGGMAAAQAGIVLGSEWQVGAFYNAPVAYDDMGSTANNINVALFQPVRLATITIGRRTDNGMMGLAVNPSFGMSRSVPVGSRAKQYRLSYDLEAIAGYSTQSDTWHADSAVAISHHFYRVTSAGKTLEAINALPSIAVRHRSLFLARETFDWGVYGELARRDESYHRKEPYSSETDLARWVFVAGGGPIIRPIPELTIAPALQLSWTEVRGNTDRATSAFANLGFPMAILSAEANPFSWLFVRAGVARRFNYVISRPPSGGANDSTTSGFAWTTGIGAKVENFQADATLQNALLTNGPAIIGGGAGVGAPGLFGSLSLRYTY
jgi:hypothetical protein